MGIGFSEIHSGLGCGCGGWCRVHDGVGLGSEAGVGFVVKASVDGIGVGWWGACTGFKWSEDGGGGLGGCCGG